MNAGELNEKVSVLELTSSNNTYSWAIKAGIWAKAEKQKGTNIFSSVGLGAKSVKFTIRKRDISLHNAFRWQGKHCFLTDITELGRMYYEVTAALIEPKICTVERTGEPTLNGLNRPVYSDPIILTFPGCLTEKYLGHTQGEPMATLEIRYVLVTPKVIELAVGELVTVDGQDYTVDIIHGLDEFKNEYEVSVRREA